MTEPPRAEPAPKLPYVLSPPEAKAAGASGLAIAVCIGICAPITAHFEGERERAYMDRAAHVLTICDGDTNDVRPGEVDTHAQCMARLDKQLALHAEGVEACTADVLAHPNQGAAAIDLAYNLGVGGYCRSGVATAFRARRWAAGCDAMLAYDKAGGRVLAGLVARRQAERALCLTDLPK